MTAINAFLRRDRGFLMTDGAFYDETGMPLGFGSKAFAIPNLNMVIAARGYAGICPLIGPHMSLRFKDFDDVVANIEPDLLEFAEGQAEYLEAVGFPTFELNLLGWSEKERRPRHFTFTNQPGAEDYLVLDETRGFCIAPGLTEEEEMVKLPKVGVFTMKPDFEQEFDPALHGVPIMIAQRRQLDRFVDRDEDGEFCSVGGLIAVAEVSKDGISQRILHRWADEVGSPAKVDDLSEKDVAVAIQKHRAVRAVSPPAAGLLPPPGLNRQQRRAWEKKHGKVAA